MREGYVERHWERKRGKRHRDIERGIERGIERDKQLSVIQWKEVTISE